MKVTDPKYSFKIVGKQFHTRGEVFRIDIDGSITGILYTHHALERIKQWGIPSESVTETFAVPGRSYRGTSGPIYCPQAVWESSYQGHI